MTHRPDAVRRFLLIALALPIALTAIGVATQLAVLSDLPDPIAIHWGADGGPDGYAAPIASIIGLAILGVGLPALLAGCCLPGLRAGGAGPSYRWLATVSAATTTLVATLATWLTVMQAGMTDARDAPSVWLPMAGALTAAALVAALSWRLQPETETSSARAQSVAPVSLADGERVAWIREAAIRPRWAAAAILTTVALMLATGVAWLLSGRDAAIGFGLTTVTVAAALATTTAFRVRADAAGLTVRSVIGVPKFHVPLDDIASVGVCQIRGIGDYGGWGIRWMPGRFGVILRSGEALEVVRPSGKRFAVTVDDAATGAAVLQAHLDR